MVWDQAVRIEAPAVLLDDMAQLGEELAEVVVVEEDGETITASGKDVVRLTGFDDAWRPGHASNVAPPQGPVRRRWMFARMGHNAATVSDTRVRLEENA